MTHPHTCAGDFVRLATSLILASAADGKAPAREMAAADATLRELQVALHRSVISSAQLVQRFQDRIAAYDRAGPGLRAVLTVDPSAADQARQADRQKPAPGQTLHGLPLLVKDTIDVRGLVTSGGSVWLQDRVARRDATVVARLRAAGAVILGKTNCDDWFAATTPGWGWSSLGGQTRNPWHLDHSPGGTSGGSAVAVAAGLAVAALGTDTSGSVLIPASWCGVVGFLPSVGSISRSGVMPIALSLDRVGILARTVDDAAILFAAIRGWDAEDTQTVRELELPGPPAVTRARPPRLGVPEDLFAAFPAEAPGVGAFDQLMQRLAAYGVDVRRSLTVGADLFRLVSERSRQIFLVEQLPSLDAYLGRHGDGSPFATAREMLARFEPRNFKVRYRDAVDRPAPDRDDASLAVRRRLAVARAALVRALEQYDFDGLALPYSVRGAPRLDHPEDDAEVKSLASHTGLPAIVVPIGTTAGGLPLALQLIGRPHGDAGLLALAAIVEKQVARTGLPALTPPLPGDRLAAP